MILRKMYLSPFIMLTAVVAWWAMPAFAEEVTFVKEYSYQASEADSKLTARAIALEQVKRLLLEELGTYLISETEVKNFQLTKDKITTLSAGIVMTQILEDKWNGEIYYLKAKIKADPKEVTKALDNLRHDMQKGKELEESKKRADEALAELAKLKKELETFKGDKQKQADYNSAASVLSAKDWFEKGKALSQSGDKYGAVNAYSKAIELDPKYTFAYNNRGFTYDKLGDNKRAIADFDRAIELDPTYAHAYYNRGTAYSNLGDNKRAIADYDRAIELDPKFALAYNNRGLAYAELGDSEKAMSDLKAVARLGDKRAQDWLRKQGIDW